MQEDQIAYLIHQQNIQQWIQIKNILVFGRDPSCSIILDSEGINERHCKIEKKTHGFSLMDLRSVKGTFVNTTKISEAYLQEGDEILIGPHQFTFTLAPPHLKNTTQKLRSKNEIWNQQLSSLHNIAQTQFPVLVLGPSGTGKEVLAEALHDDSTRSSGPLIKVNCSALTETLVESELFGHIKGSFTGAISDRKGAFEAARGGTLFLDEIGDLPMGLQAKILRAIENEEIRPVGADRSVKTDVRIIAATHQNLKSKIGLGEFRMDLFYRLSVISISPPALSARMEDFEDLLYGFAKKMRVRFSFSAIQKMKKHHWPGNIRELRNVVARASAFYPRMTVEESHVPCLIDDGLKESHLEVGLHPKNTPQLPVIKEIEKQMILKRLVVNHGNQRKTAIDLGLPKSTLHDRLRAYDIDPRQFSHHQEAKFL